MPEYQSPYNLLKVIFKRRYPGYLYRRELIDTSEYGMPSTEMVNCYCLDTGIWIGDARTARYLCHKVGLRKFEGSGSGTAVIGYQPKENKWYGWSHRAMCGFGIGDKIFESRYGDENTPFTQHGKHTITTLSQAKLAARRFAASVS